MENFIIDFMQELDRQITQGDLPLMIRLDEIVTTIGKTPILQIKNDKDKVLSMDFRALYSDFCKFGGSLKVFCEEFIEAQYRAFSYASAGETMKVDKEFVCKNVIPIIRCDEDETEADKDFLKTKFLDLTVYYNCVNFLAYGICGVVEVTNAMLKDLDMTAEEVDFHAGNNVETIIGSRAVKYINNSDEDSFFIDVRGGKTSFGASNLLSPHFFEKFADDLDDDLVVIIITQDWLIIVPYRNGLIRDSVEMVRGSIRVKANKKKVSKDSLDISYINKAYIYRKNTGKLEVYESI